MKFKYVSLFVMIGLIGLVMYMLNSDSTTDMGLLGDIHEHADFKVYLNGDVVNFSQDKYMSTKEHLLSNFVHLHDMDEEVIHKHSTGIKLGFFFNSLGITFNSTCFVIDGVSYCNDGNSKLEMYANGKLNSEFGDYEFKDLDRILITYGSSDVSSELLSVSDKACIQSGTCPDRGEPSDESDCLSSSDCIA